MSRVLLLQRLLGWLVCVPAPCVRRGGRDRDHSLRRRRGLRCFRRHGRLFDRLSGERPLRGGRGRDLSELHGPDLPRRDGLGRRYLGRRIVQLLVQHRSRGRRVRSLRAALVAARSGPADQGPAGRPGCFRGCFGRDQPSDPDVGGMDGGGGSDPRGRSRTPGTLALLLASELHRVQGGLPRHHDREQRLFRGTRVGPDDWDRVAEREHAPPGTGGAPSSPRQLVAGEPRGERDPRRQRSQRFLGGERDRGHASLLV